MIRLALSSVRMLNHLKFYCGVALKPSNRRKFNHARRLRTECRKEREYLDRIQLEKLNSLLSYANRNVEYYHQLFRSLGLVRDRTEAVTLSDLGQLKTIPFLDKEIMKREGESLHSREHRERGSRVNTSGGSTGQKAMFIQDSIFGERSSANFRLARWLMGIPFHASDSILVWGADCDIGVPVVDQGFRTWIKSTVAMNACRMSKDDIRCILHIANVKRPTFIRSYATALNELAKFAIQEGISVVPQNVVISTAEVLTDEMRQRVESVFGCKVFNYYGSREVGAVASECLAHDGLHLLEDNNVVEIVDNDGREVAPGETGELIVTNLNNYSMPFVRFRIGDMATAQGTQVACPCGCNYRRVSQLVGRREDYFRLKNGDVVSNIEGLLFPYAFIERYQIIQKDFDWVEFVIQSQERLPENEMRKVETKLKAYMGADCRATWRYTGRIEPGPTGKYRFIISELPATGVE